MGISRKILFLTVGSVVITVGAPAHAWWGYGHETIAQGVVPNLAGTGDLERFFTETNDQFSKIPHIEPAATHYIDIDTTATTTGNAGVVSYANDFANFRAGTFTFPTNTAAAVARYGNSYINGNGSVPWTADTTLSTLTTKMQTAVTYDDWYRLLPTAGALTHYLEDMHQPMHLTENYNPGGLHGRYEGGQFEDGSVRRYPELRASMTPVAPTYYGTSASGGFVNALFNRIPTDYDKNVAIRNADTVAQAAGTGAVYFDSLWNQTNAITKDSFQHAAAVIASALYTAYVNAGSPAIPQATLYAAPTQEQSTIRNGGPITSYINEDYFQVRGGTSSTPSYGVARFNMATIKAQCDARFGAGLWAIDNVAFATEIDSVNTGSIAVFHSANDTINIQPGSPLRYTDDGAPLGLNLSTDTPLLQYDTVTRPDFTITRFDSTTPEVFTWTPLQTDILSGGLITLVLSARTATTGAQYYGGAGLSLEVSAHAIPVKTWNVDSSGDWSSAGNWAGGVPNAIDAAARFDSVIVVSREVTVDAPQTVGHINFNSTNRYVVEGSSALTLSSSTGPATIASDTGNHTISAPIALNSDLVVTVTPSASLLTMSGNLTANGKAITKDGAGTVEFKYIRDAASLTVNAGSVQLVPGQGNAGTSVLASLPAFSTSGRFDVNDNRLIVQFGTTPSPLAATRAAIIAGRGGTDFANATWQGTGGIASAAAAPGGIGDGANPGDGISFAIGYVENSFLPQLGLSSYTTFGGQPVDSGSLLIRFTRGADINLDGKVNTDDVTVVGALYNNSESGQWFLGDFDFDGICDTDDITVLGAMYDATAPALAAAQLTAQYGADFAAAFARGQAMAAIPEPACGLVAIAATGLFSSARRRHRRYRNLKT